MNKLKIIFQVPKGRAGIEVEKAENIKKFAFKGKLIDSQIINPDSFYYLFEYPTEEERNKIYLKKVPAADLAMKKIWRHLLKLFNRSNTLMAKFEWNLLKARHWVLSQFRKQSKDMNKEQMKSWEEFIETADLKGIDDMRKWLEQDLITAEIIE